MKETIELKITADTLEIAQVIEREIERRQKGAIFLTDVERQAIAQARNMIKHALQGTNVELVPILDGIIGRFQK
ncbi:hypothetical protein CPT_Maja_083 [Burkholderia phage Maja]|uniref:Uncharacterized protein n=1 Tax=Burkholderia phage Maja TaxID=2767571 RepID=A0A7S6U1T9_9CAUD|nr:hypothetical protein CPT_Maja_083 [Burkholderia phage Maja]